MAVILSFLGPIDESVWEHIKDYLLFEYASNTLQLLVAVIATSSLIGVFFAALVSFGDFPGRRFLMGCLLTPLAFPAYIYAFVYTGVFSYSGILASLEFFSFRSFWGLVFTLSLSFYPYIYLLSFQGFSSIGSRFYEMAMVNGLSPLKSFCSGALPISFPWIMTGVILVSLETIADFGAASIFSFDTLTIGIYKAWFGFFSLPTAMRMSTILVGLGILLILFKQYYQKDKLYENKVNSTPINRINLGWMATFTCVIFLTFALTLPLLQLILWSSGSEAQWPQIIKLSAHTLIISLIGAIGINFFGFLAIASMRISPIKLSPFLINLPLIGYGLPGTVIATIIFFLFGGVHGFIGSLLLLVLAYFIRFFPLAMTTIGSAGKRVPLYFEELAVLANIPRLTIFKKISIPLLKPGWLLSFVFLFIEIVKELPMTLIMRPTGYSTLATKVFEFSSEGEWAHAAIPSIVIVFISSFSVIWIIARKIGK